MADVDVVPENGLVAVSTFSGCGGSGLGLRMAGIRVAWASEFVPAAAECYLANRPGAVLSTADVRSVSPDDVLRESGVRAGELDLLEGSPPCAAFSTAGRRSAAWGETRKYSDTSQRVDDLFDEFLRLLGGLRPRAFLAENVEGLARGKARGYLAQVLAAARGHGYRVEARVVDAAGYGVPQTRRRLLVVGLRDDQPGTFEWPAPGSPTRVLDAVPWVVGLEPEPDPVPEDADGQIGRFAIGAEAVGLKVGGQSGRFFSLVKADPFAPCPTITVTCGNPSAAGVVHPTKPRKWTLLELRRICGFPDDFVLVPGDYSRSWERLGRAVAPPVYEAMGRAISRALGAG